MPPWTLPLLIAAAPSWPVELVEPREVTRKDLDGDHHPDLVVTAGDGGSGFWEQTTCVRDGRSGAMACDIVDSTPYSLFAGMRRVRSTPGPNAADPLLGSDDCEPADPSAPSQAMMWALQAPLSTDQPLRPAGPWLPGPPVDQRSVCLTVPQAATLSGGMDWDPSGEPPEDIAARGWRVRYSASRPQWMPGELLPREFVRSPRLVGEVGALRLYRLGHALVVYDPARDRHAWLLNVEALQGHGFKFDRWEAIEGIEAKGTDALALTLSGELVGYEDPPQPWMIDLSGLLALP